MSEYVNQIKDSIEYRLIAEFYGDRTAKRSQIPLINHIDEGLAILESVNATVAAGLAYCLHPLLQNYDDLDKNINSVCNSPISLRAVMLAMEYRRAANAYLCRPLTDDWSIGVAQFHIGELLPEVRDMLIADKVQNRKDFMAAHYGTHARSEQLFKYFNNWHAILDHPLPQDQNYEYIYASTSTPV